MLLILLRLRLSQMNFVCLLLFLLRSELMIMRAFIINFSIFNSKTSWRYQIWHAISFIQIGRLVKIQRRLALFEKWRDGFYIGLNFTKHILCIIYSILSILYDIFLITLFEIFRKPAINMRRNNTGYIIKIFTQDYLFASHSFLWIKNQHLR